MPNSRLLDPVPDADADELPDLTNELQSAASGKLIIGQGSFGVVYHCRTATVDVAVKAVTSRMGTSDAEREKLNRSFRRELGIWRRLDHPNIVPLLGKTRGTGFGSNHDCMVSMWMPRGTLHVYINSQQEMLMTSDRIRLIKDVANGLNYLHSQDVVHGDLHPGNVLIDGEGGARLTDFGFSQVLLPGDDASSYLQTMSVHHGALMWAAPELVYPKLNPEWNKDGKARATLNSDIYSLGSIIIFVLSGKPPCQDVLTACKQLEKCQSPQRQDFPMIPDDIWRFVVKCWSPKEPGVRPSAQEVVSFMSDNLRDMSTDHNYGVQLPRRSSVLALPPSSLLTRMRPYVVVIFGRTGVGVSSLVNLIVGYPVSNDHPDSRTPTQKVKAHFVTLPESNKQFRLYEVPGFGGQLPDATIFKTIRQIERAEGIDLFIYCLRKEKTTIMPNIVRPIRDNVPEQNVPMIAVVTGLEWFGMEGGMEEWWDVPLSDGHTNGAVVEQICFGGYDRFDAHACVTTLPPRDVDPMEALRKRRDLSEEQIRRLIVEQCGGHKRTATESNTLNLHPIRRLLPARLPWNQSVREPTRAYTY